MRWTAMLIVVVATTIYTLGIPPLLVPLAEAEWHGDASRVRLGGDRWNLQLGVLARSENPTRWPRVDESKSYATDGTSRYSVVTRRSAYGIEHGYSTPWMQEEVGIRRTVAGVRLPARWRNGQWRLHLEYVGGDGHAPIDESFRMYTYWYSIFLDGPPN